MLDGEQLAINSRSTSSTSHDDDEAFRRGERMGRVGFDSRIFFPGWKVTRVSSYVRGPFPSKEIRRISERDDPGPRCTREAVDLFASRMQGTARVRTPSRARSACPGNTVFCIWQPCARDSCNKITASAHGPRPLLRVPHPARELKTALA
jgi:hypothetical protein